MKSNVLFLQEKWHATRPEYGDSILSHILLNTFAQTQNRSFHTLHYDELKLTYNQHIDDVLVTYCQENSINVIFISLVGGSGLNPSTSIYQQLRDLGVKIVMFWPDSNEGDLKTREQLDKFIDLNAVLDGTDRYNRFANNLVLWTPQDRNLFFYEPNKEFDVTFWGSKHRNDSRYAYLYYLSQAVSNLMVGGGQNEQRMSHLDYASFLRRSRICLNFSPHPFGYHQVKGRVFDVLACGGLLFENENTETPKFFTPNIDYVEFGTPEDLVEKVKYYTDNKVAAEQIAFTGHTTYTEKYNTTHFWNLILDRIK